LNALKDTGAGAVTAGVLDQLSYADGNVNPNSRLADAGINFASGFTGMRLGRGSARNFREAGRLGAQGNLGAAQHAAIAEQKFFGSAKGLGSFLSGSLAPITTFVPQGLRAQRESVAAENLTNALKAKANEIAQASATASGDMANAFREGAGGLSQNPVLAALLLAGGVGAAGWGINRAITNRKPQEMTMNMKEPGGRIRVTLPTTNANDAETVLDLPFDQEQVLTRPMHDRLAIDTRKRLRAESKQRKKPRGYLFNTQVA